MASETFCMSVSPPRCDMALLPRAERRRASSAVRCCPCYSSVCWSDGCGVAAGGPLRGAGVAGAAAGAPPGGH
eukprot:6489795-Pyramimonas_sp.AAC.1